MTMIKRLLIISILTSGLTWFAMHRAKAWAGEELMRLGDSTMQTMESDKRENRKLKFNGLTMSIVTGRSEQSLTAMLDEFEANCRHGENRLLPTPPESEPELSPVFRWEEDEGGVAICVAPPDASHTVSAWAERLRKFSQTRDISDVGQVRYLRVMRGKSSTSFVTMGSEGSMQLDRLLPRFGDAPGVDMSGVPRPKASIRTLSAHEENKSALLATYKVKSSPEQAAEQYRSQVAAAGLQVQENPMRPNSFVVHGPDVNPTFVAITGHGAQAFVAMIR